MPFSLNLAWRLFKHEARRGELTIILLAIVLSVSAVLSLSLFSERLQGALTERSAAFLAADSQLRSGKPIDPSWLAQAQTKQLRTAQQISTRSMAFGETQMSLVDLRAVNENYPLKGEVLVAQQPFGEETLTADIPLSGEAWIDSRLFQLLDIELGDTIYVGDAKFNVTRVLAEIPDAGFSVFSADPIVLINLQDMAKTNVTGPGSRVDYIAYFAGEQANLDDYFNWLQPLLVDEVHRWQSVKDDDSPIGRSVARAERYFLLASLLAIVLAAVSIAVAAQRYSQRHYDPVAIMKTLGATSATIRKVYVLQVTLIALVGIVIGVVVGFVIQSAVVSVLADKVDVSLDVWHWRPVIIATFTGAICAVLFSIYPLLRLFTVPPLRVLRRTMESNLQSKTLQFGVAGTAILMLMWAYSRDLKLSLILMVSGVVLVVGLLLITFVLIAVGRKLGQGSMGPWQLAWARIRRRAMDNSIQLISFSITILLLLIVLVMRNDMIAQWRAQLPEGTPNYFLINITPEQKPKLDQHFKTNDVTIDYFYPVVRGRFAAVNGELVDSSVDNSAQQAQQQEQASNESEPRRRGLGREANLTWSNRLQNENKIIEGSWHATVDDFTDGIYPVSVEVGAAQRLDLKMGDVITFNIGSELVQTRITSIREVNWQSMQPNFFFVIHPQAMAAFKPTYITSFFLPTERKAELTQLLQPFASITLFDVDARIEQLRGIVDQVSMAVEFILILVLAAGSLVLIAQVQASMDERQQELAILRTLGAKGSLIRFSVINEFLIIGLVAGFMAALASELSLYLLQTQIFQMEPSIHLEFWIIAPVVGAIVVGVLGAGGCWQLLKLNTSTLLRKLI